MNPCTFSPDRRHRYVLEHRWDDMFAPRRIMWIGLNPSTADERQLDPTLRRIRGFSDLWGYNVFVMTNLFAFRATDPRDMKRATDPVGADNDEHLIAQAGRCQAVVACWGTHGAHLNRAAWVHRLFVERGVVLHTLGFNADGSPRHPLYVPLRQKLELFPLSA